MGNIENSNYDLMKNELSINLTPSESDLEVIEEWLSNEKKERYTKHAMHYSTYSIAYFIVYFKYSS